MEHAKFNADMSGNRMAPRFIDVDGGASRNQSGESGQPRSGYGVIDSIRPELTRTMTALIRGAGWWIDQSIAVPCPRTSINGPPWRSVAQRWISTGADAQATNRSIPGHAATGRPSRPSQLGGRWSHLAEIHLRQRFWSRTFERARTRSADEAHNPPVSHQP